MRADVVVVGAGPAGSVMARRLAEAGADVLLLEAGDHAASSRAGLLDVGPGSRVVSRHRALLGGKEVEIPRGRTLGGSGAVNGGYCAPARPWELAEWGSGWPHRYAVGLARAAERLRPVLSPMGPVAARVAAAFPGRVSAIAQARRGGRRVTAFDAWDPPGAGVRVRSGARVSRVRWVGGVVGGRCDGVVLSGAAAGPGTANDANDDGDSDDDIANGMANDIANYDDSAGEEITAREVILCAGTIGSAAILTDSGLGASTGHPVGDRVQEHPEVLLELPDGFAGDRVRGPVEGLPVELSEVSPVDRTDGDRVLPPLLSHVVRLEVPTGDSGLPEVEVRPYAVPMHQVIPGAEPMPATIGISLMNPQGHGRIDRTAGAGADGTVWLPDDPRDAAALAAAVEIVVAGLGLASVESGEAGILPSTSQHLSGSARIGEVVDDAGRVMGVAGLRVADASVLPVLPRCGPYYTVLAVAEALAAEVAADRPW